jgi:hypothetical protein
LPSAAPEGKLGSEFNGFQDGTAVTSAANPAGLVVTQVPIAMLVWSASMRPD